jgi:hypothetical protein
VAELRPIARTEGLMTEEVDDELLVYDQRHESAHRLNRTAAIVWRNADGNRSVGDLVKVLAETLGDLADEDLVMVALDDLGRSGLLLDDEPRPADETRVSRRRFIRRVGVVGTAALALPIVYSMASPTPAAAQSDVCYCYCYCPCDICYCICYCDCEGLDGAKSCASCASCATGKDE